MNLTLSYFESDKMVKSKAEMNLGMEMVRLEIRYIACWGKKWRF